MITIDDAKNICRQQIVNLQDEKAVIQRYIFDRVGLVLEIPQPITNEDQENLDNTLIDAKKYYLG